MNRSRGSLVLCLVLVGVAGVAAVGIAQEEILSFSFDPLSLELSPGERAALTVRIENESAREADGIALTWIGPEGFTLDPAPQEIDVLEPFESLLVTVSVLASDAAEVGAVEGEFEFLYSYCIGDLCFQIVESRALPLRVIERSGSPIAVPDPVQPPGVEPPVRRAVGPWVPYALAAGAAVAAVLTALRARRGKAVWPSSALLVLAAAAGLGYGVALDQHEQAQSIAAVLCISCVGIEEAVADVPRLGDAEEARIRALSVPVELIVFYAPWCRSCPYAEALVEQVAALNERVTYRLIDVEREPELARRYGVLRSGRTVVPAIVRPGFGSVLFGIEDLERRLTALLEEEA
ncbi:MAG: hypothetical protein PHW86_07665 [Candidatus Bipolaricaulis sp.]|nr:hypothetical protein [Candidatus Bipolaricaulis sp.]